MVVSYGLMWTYHTSSNRIQQRKNPNWHEVDQRIMY